MSTKSSLVAPIVVAASLLGIAFDASAEQPLTVFARAIGEGQATGEVTGPIATRLQEMTKSKEPVTFSAKVIKRFKQQGCARLEVETSQQRVPLQEGGFAPITTRWALNVCVDGSAPTDLNEVALEPGPRIAGTRK